jgi:hypothetical protein
MTNFLSIIKENRRILLLSLLFLVVFILLRIPALDSPLHQDEYKWPEIVNPALLGEVEIPHPPLAQFIYESAGRVVGYDIDFRLVPLFFGAINLLLLFYLMQMLFGQREAIIASLIWIFSYFSVLASLMVDTDGAVMPFFFLISLIGYFKLRFTEDKRFLWWFVLILGVTGGFLTKISFLLVPVAIFADFLWSKKESVTKKDLFKYVGYGILSLVGLGIILFVLKFALPFFDFTKPFTYLTRFFGESRGWFQTGIQVVKALLYSSPLLVLAPFFGSWEMFRKVKVFFFFLLLAFFFYIILFDSSLGALDRYLQLLILPLTVLTSIVLGQVRWDENPKYEKFLLFGIIVGAVIFILQFLPHYVPSLHPKAEWLSRFLSLNWNFVYPFSGGSGPLGFYVSFLVLVGAWIISLLGLIFAWLKPHLKKSLIIFLIPISFIYSGIFIEEYSFGLINGSAPKLLANAVEFIESNPEIEMVTVYNDNGGDEIRRTGKYRKRLYTSPQFDLGVKVETLNKYKEHYFVLDVPRVDPNSPYQRYFESCKVIYEEFDQKMSATIYDCQKAPELTL